MAWTEITDPQEIFRHWITLQRLIKEATRPGGKRRVGFPGDSRPFSVRVGLGAGKKPYWIYCDRSSNGNLLTLVGRTPQDPRWQLQIDLQCNFRANKFSRDMGGAFLRDELGNVLLAHRGILTRGQRIDKEEVVRLLPKRWWVAAKDEHGRVARFISIARLDSDALFADLCTKAEKIREKFSNPVAPNGQTKPAGKAPGPGGKNGMSRIGGKAAAKNPLDIHLDGYKREFDRTWTIPAKGPRTAKRRHGLVVNALSELLQPKGNVSNPTAIDLVLTEQEPDEIHHVFEVKSSSGSQAIYTALGQLLFNAAALQRRYKKGRIVRYLVLPGDVKERVRQRFCKELGFEIVTFTLGANNVVKFSGLNL
jgi:hypothetical protein